MARKNKYSKLKPKVSPLTYIIIGLFFIGLVLTIVLSIDTPKQNFNKRFELEGHNYELVSLKNLEKKIESKEKVVVVIQVGLKSLAPKNLLTEVYDLYNNEDRYNDLDLNNLPNKVYYVEVKDQSVLDDFIEEYEIKKTSSKPLMLAFNEGELVAEYDSEHEPSGLTAENKEKAKLIRNVRTFFEKIIDEF